MVGWHHQLNGHEFEQSLGDGEGTGKPGMLQFMRLQRVGLNNKQQKLNVFLLKTFSYVGQ